MDIKISVQAQKQNLGIEAAPHLRARLSTRMIMLITLLCLMPAFGVMLWFYGFGMLWQCLVSLATAMICETALALLRRRSLIRTLTDCSAPVTCVILAMTLPPLLPWYLTAAATAFAILLVKGAFGGLGMNIFNPAMAGFIFLFVSCSGAMFNGWVTPSPAGYSVATLDASYRVVFEGADPLSLREAVKNSNASLPDALTGATMLESVKTTLKTGQQVQGLAPDFTEGAFLGYALTAAALALGGLVLMILRIVIVRMVVAFFVSLVAFGVLGHYLWPDIYLPPLEQLLLGGSVLAGFFIITDPVTNAGTAKGRLVFAVFTAFLIVTVRALGSYADSVAFSVMLANAAAPLIDVLTRRRAFGVGYRKGGLD